MKPTQELTVDEAYKATLTINRNRTK